MTTKKQTVAATRWHRTHKTKNPNVLVKINYTLHADGSVRLSGYALDAKTEIRLDGAKAMTRTARSEKEIPQRETILINSILKHLPKSDGKASSPRRTETTGKMAEAFRVLEENNDAIDHNWNESTKKHHMAFFKHNILPFLCRFENGGFTELDRTELEETLMSSILSSKKGNGSFKTGRTTLNNNMRAAHIIYQRMRQIDPYLPEIILYEGVSTIKAAPESAKSLSAEIRRRLILAIPDIIQKDPIFAQALILMLCGGLRDAEACAMRPEHLDFSDPAFVLALVCEQIKDGSPVEILKTSNSYRVVVLPFWARVMLLKCRDRYAEMTGSEGIPPISRVSAFAARVKQLLMDCGCDTAYFSAAQLLIDLRPDRDLDMVSTTVVSYVLRHDYASRAKNICGLTNDEIDALLGHKRSANARRNGIDLALPDHQKLVAQKMERFVFDPAISLNPANDPIRLKANERISLIPYNAYRFANEGNEPLTVDLDIYAAEPDELICFHINAGKTPDLKPHRKAFEPAKRSIIGIGDSKKERSH